jgi:hypothetical protein
VIEKWCVAKVVRGGVSVRRFVKSPIGSHNPTFSRAPDGNVPPPDVLYSYPSSRASMHIIVESNLRTITQEMSSKCEEKILSYISRNMPKQG